MKLPLCVLALALFATPALADTVYNDAIGRAEVLSKLAETQISGAEAFAAIGSKDDACQALKDGISGWNNAATWYEKARQAPKDVADTNRLSDAELGQRIDAEKEKMRLTQEVVDKHCQ